ncbi:response regulator [bacterium]|nr:response regulator [bacterium]
MNNRILLVDDDPDFVSAIETILENAGYSCHKAYSAKEGLNQIPQIKPNLILLDIMMEDISAGFRFVRECRQSKDKEKKNPIPIIIISSVQKVTGFNLTERVGSPICPADYYLEKPVEPEVLLKQIKKIISARDQIKFIEHQCESTYTTQHKGPVKKYLVTDPSSEIEYGQFYYCEHCANMDRERGLIVKCIE